MNILTERVYCPRKRKDVEETHKGKNQLLIAEGAKKALEWYGWTRKRHMIMVPRSLVDY